MAVLEGYFANYFNSSNALLNTFVALFVFALGEIISRLSSQCQQTSTVRRFIPHTPH